MDNHSIWTGPTRRTAQRVQLPAAPTNGGNEFCTTATAATTGDESLQGATKQQSLQSLGKRKEEDRITVIWWITIYICPSLFKGAELTQSDSSHRVRVQFPVSYAYHRQWRSHERAMEYFMETLPPSSWWTWGAKIIHSLESCWYHCWMLRHSVVNTHVYLPYHCVF